MTEAGEQWVEGHVKSELANQDGAVPPSLEMTLLEVRRSQAEFWISAAFDEVEKRAAQIEGGSSNGPSPAISYRLIDLAREEAIGQAFDELKKELLG